MSRPTGRPPKPTELKLLEGNPGGRPLSRKVLGMLPDDAPEAPAFLEAAGRDEWNRAWTYGRAWLAWTDIGVLTQLCRYVDRSATLWAQIEEEGLLQMGENTHRSFVHSLSAEARGLDSVIRDLWSLCYLTPTDRGRANVKPADDADPLTKWAGQ
jgi:P27 family predicted phage terminase small subunit